MLHYITLHPIILVPGLRLFPGRMESPPPRQYPHPPAPAHTLNKREHHAGKHYHSYKFAIRLLFKQSQNDPYETPITSWFLHVLLYVVCLWKHTIAYTCLAMHKSCINHAYNMHQPCINHA